MSLDSLNKAEKYTFERGANLATMAAIEDTINAFVSVHYFGSFNENFASEMLESEYFPLHLRIKVVKTILRKHYPEINFPFSELEEMQRLRNIMAHIVTKTDLSGTAETVAVGESFYPYQGVRHPVEEVHARFKELEDKVVAGLGTLPGIKLMIKKTAEVTPEDLKQEGLITRTWLPKKKGK